MTLDLALALIGFAFVMSASPGPSNFLLLASGVTFGFQRSLPLLLGISFGFLSMVLLVGLGFGQVIERVPLLLHGTQAGLRRLRPLAGLEDRHRAGPSAARSATRSPSRSPSCKPLCFSWSTRRPGPSP